MAQARRIGISNSMFAAESLSVVTDTRVWAITAVEFANQPILISGTLGSRGTIQTDSEALHKVAPVTARTPLATIGSSGEG